LQAVIQRYSTMTDSADRPLCTSEQRKAMIKMVERHAACVADPEDYVMHVVHGASHRGRLTITTPR
jgi:hypothetical protein